ncbi:MFS general substrate transporter, partial [Meredithblackwellia eburnea MCA 4105]
MHTTRADDNVLRETPHNANEHTPTAETTLNGEDGAVKLEGATEEVEEHLPRVDGGRKAWSIVFASSLGFFCTFGYTNSFGAYQSYYQMAYPTASSATISLIGGLQVASVYLSGLFIGRWIDKFGPKAVMLTGTTLCTVALMLLSLTRAIWQIFLTQGLLFGVGMSAIVFPSTSMTATWFVERRAFALGVINGGSSIGGIFWPIVAHKLLDGPGFPWLCRASGFIVLLLAGTATLIIEPRVQP